MPVAVQRKGLMVQRVQKTVDLQHPQSQFIEKAMDAPAGQQRQVHMSRTVQKNVQTPSKQSPGKMVDVSMDVASPSARAEGSRRLVEVARVIPQELVKPAGEKTSVRERVKQFEMNGGVLCMTAVEVPRVTPGDTQCDDAESEAPNKRRKQEKRSRPTCSCALLPVRWIERPGNEVGGGPCRARDKAHGRTRGVSSRATG